jgi:hypothetical protein
MDPPKLLSHLEKFLLQKYQPKPTLGHVVGKTLATDRHGRNTDFLITF